MEQAITVSTVSQYKVRQVSLHTDHARDLKGVTCPLCLERNSLNAETIKAIEDARAGIGVTSYSTVEELFADLNSDDD